MGKAKRNKVIKKESIRPNPVGIPSVRSLEQWEAETAEQMHTKSGYVQNIVEQVESRLAEQRDTGLIALANAAENPEIMQEVLSTNVLNTAAGLLLDDSLIVCHSASGCLRNLSATSGNICEAMVSQGVMKPLVTLFKQKYGIDWAPAVSKAKSSATGTFKTDTATEAFIQALHLLSNLCAASEKALGVFNEEKLFYLLPRALDVQKFGLPTALACARCLHTVTEENRDSIPNIPEFTQLLLTILKETDDKEPDYTLLQTLVTGTLYNLLGSGSEIGIARDYCVSLILQTLGRVLATDEIKEIKGFSSDVPLHEEGMDIGRGTTGQEGVMELDLKVKLEASASRIFKILEAETLALEIFSNIVFAEDDESGDGLEDSDEEPMEEDCVSEKVVLPFDFNVEASQAVRSEGLIAKVLSKSKDLPLNVSEILENNSEFGKDILEKHGHLRSVALLCLQNVLQAFDLETLGGLEQLREIYTTLSKILPSSIRAEKKGSCGLEFLEAVTSGLRAVLQKAIDENCEGVVESFSSQDLEILLSLYVLGTEKSRMATDVVRLVGSFGVLVSRRRDLSAASRELMLKIGEFLLGCLSFGVDKLELIRTSEALDTIFDVFAEDDFNDVLKQLTLVEKLRHLAPHFKKQVRTLRRHLGESRGVVETAKSNLSRFIEYKMGLGC